jgi:membrane protein implicated in regulation of membrane protease activity
VIRREHRSALYLAAVALAALAISLVLALAPMPRWHSRPNSDRAVQNTANPPSEVQPRIAAPAPQPAPASTVAAVDASSLWNVLVPWALAVDAFAVLGIVVVLALRHPARRRPRTRT